MRSGQKTVEKQYQAQLEAFKQALFAISPSQEMSKKGKYVNVKVDGNFWQTLARYIYNTLITVEPLREQINISYEYEIKDTSKMNFFEKGFYATKKKTNAAADLIRVGRVWSALNDDAKILEDFSEEDRDLYNDNMPKKEALEILKAYAQGLDFFLNENKTQHFPERVNFLINPILTVFPIETIASFLPKKLLQNETLKTVLEELSQFRKGSADCIPTLNLYLPRIYKEVDMRIREMEAYRDFALNPQGLTDNLSQSDSDTESSYTEESSYENDEETSSQPEDSDSSYESDEETSSQSEDSDSSFVEISIVETADDAVETENKKAELFELQKENARLEAMLARPLPTPMVVQAINDQISAYPDVFDDLSIPLEQKVDKACEIIQELKNTIVSIKRKTNISPQLETDIQNKVDRIEKFGKFLLSEKNRIEEKINAKEKEKIQEEAELRTDSEKIEKLNYRLDQVIAIMQKLAFRHKALIDFKQRYEDIKGESKKITKQIIDKLNDPSNHLLPADLSIIFEEDRHFSFTTWTVDNLVIETMIEAEIDIAKEELKNYAKTVADLENAKREPDASITVKEQFIACINEEIQQFKEEKENIDGWIEGFSYHAMLIEEDLHAVKENILSKLNARQESVDAMKSNIDTYFANRKKEYRVRDFFDRIASTLLSCFGCKTEVDKRMEYYDVVKNKMAAYVVDGSKETKKALSEAINTGITTFAPRTKDEKSKSYGNTFKATLEAVEAGLKQAP